MINLTGLSKRSAIVIVVVAVVVCALLVGGWQYWQNQQYARPAGRLQSLSNQILMDRAVSYAAAQDNMVCTGQLHAYDDRYLYTSLACQPVRSAVQSDLSSSGPARFEYRKGSQILSLTRPGGDGNSRQVKRLFPKPAYQALHDFEANGGNLTLLNRARIKAEK